MKKAVKKGWALSLSLALTITGVPLMERGLPQVAAEDENVLEVNADNRYAANNGVFEGWGTSLCWFGNRIGGSEQTSSEAAELLCNEEKGLGMNIIRFNIGGGDEPTHDHITRTDSKMPGYWGEYNEADDTFTYDFTKDANQRNVLLKMIKENHDLTVEAFSNSAPYFMTVSGCTSGSENGGDNLREDKYDEFAEYLAAVVKAYKEEYGVEFSSVEAMNENGWSIDRNGNKQEGCSFGYGESQSKMILALDNALKNNNLQDLILAGCDQSSPKETVSCLEAMSEEARNALERIDTHTYLGTAKAKTGLRDKAVELNKNLWMSEVDGADTAGKAPGEMGAALGFAKRIAGDMDGLQPSAWIMWQAIGSYCGSEPFAGNYDPETLDQKTLDTNGFWGVTYADMDQEKVVLTKKYYGFGQYTRYIHAGDYMIQGDNTNTISFDPVNKELKIVTFNTAGTEKEMRYNLSGFEVEDGQVEVVRTSGALEDGENWAQLDNLDVDSTGFDASLAPNSITTYIVKGVDWINPPVIPTESPVPSEEPSQAPESPAPSVEPSQAPASAAPAQTPVNTTAPDPITTVSGVAKVSGVKVAKIKKNTATVSWKKVSGADQYIVAYSTNKGKLAKLKDNGMEATGTKATGGVVVKTVTKEKLVLKGLKKNKNYYVKVCACNTTGDNAVYGKYSGVKKFKTKKK